MSSASFSSMDCSRRSVRVEGATGPHDLRVAGARAPAGPPTKPVIFYFVVHAITDSLIHSRKLKMF